MCLELWVKSKWYWVQCVGSSLYTQLIVICSLTYKVVGKVLATSDMGRTAVQSQSKDSAIEMVDTPEDTSALILQKKVHAVSLNRKQNQTCISTL